MTDKITTQIQANAAELAEEFEEKKIKLSTSFVKHLNKLSKAKANELAMLANINDAVEALDDKKVASRINGFLTANEKNYLMAKDLAEFIKAGEKVDKFANAYSDATPSEKYGNIESFKCSLEKINGGYKFHLPPMSGKKQTDRIQGDGKVTYYMVSKLIRDYERTSSDILKIVPNPMAIFVHNIKKGNEMQEVMDADNIDVKVAIDALFGFLINDDNVLSLWTMQLGKTCAGKSSCDLYIIDRGTFSEWSSHHKALFGKSEKKPSKTKK